MIIRYLGGLWRGILTLSLLAAAAACNLSWERPDAGPDVPVDMAESDEPVSRPEECNGYDDDLDGEIDEDFDCIYGQLVTCTTECGSRGNGICTLNCTMPDPASCIPPPERCNGLDDDCNDIPDDPPFECVMGSTMECSTACGDGIATCGDVCTWGPCVGTGEWDCDPGRTRDCSDTLDCGVGTQTCDDECHWLDCIQSTRSETCNGRDDNCDDTVDEAVLTKIGSDVRITTTPSVTSLYPFLLWTGSQFFVSWVEGNYNGGPDVSQRHIVAAFLDTAGNKVLPEFDVSVSSGDHFPAIPVLTTTELAVAWGDYRTLTNYDIYMARISFLGIRTTEHLLVNSLESAEFPGLVWTGFQYGLSWQDRRYDPVHTDVYFQIFNQTGHAETTELNVTNNSVKDEFALRPLYTGSEFLVIYQEVDDGGSSRCRMARVSSSGSLAGGPSVLVDENSYFCMASWIASTSPAFTGFGMSWMTAALDTEDSNLRFALFNPDGTLAAGPLTVHGASTQTLFPVTLYNEDHHAVAISWVEQQTWTTGGECYFAEVNLDTAALEIRTPPTAVSGSGNTARTLCTAAWTGSSYGFTWEDQRDSADVGEIYFALFGCM
jgi:hypothetical protein